MRKLFVAIILAMTCILYGCGGNSGSSAGSQESNVGPFSAVGGWKVEEGIIMLLDEGGSGLMLSEVKYEGDTSNLNFPTLFKTSIEWKEDKETVTVKANETEYPFQKKKEGDKEMLESGVVSYARLTEDEVNEYKEKAKSAADTNAGASGAAANEASDLKSIDFTDTVLLDNDLITVELVKFYEKEVKWYGTDGPQIEKNITLKVHNKSDKEIMFNLKDGYIKDESVSLIMGDGNQGPAPGKIKTYSYDIQYNTSPNPTPLESLEDLYTFDVNIQTYVYDGDSLKDENNTRVCINDVINGTNTEAEGESQDASVVKETDYMTIEGIYVDNSYSTKDNDRMRFLYILYTAHTKDQNLKIDCKSMNVTINDTNSYKAVRSKKETRYLRSYYNGAYLKEVYVGDEVKFVETFEVPEGELEAGRSITISKSQIPDADKIRLTTDDIVFCDSPEEIAEKADPEGYEEEMWALEDADGEREAAVKEEINGYQWDVTAHDIKYTIEFWEPNEYELRTSFSTSDGTYEVKNGYIICTNDMDGKLEIPYTYEDGKVKVDVITAFDFFK